MTSIANCIPESLIRGVFTAENISDDLREIEKLENAVGSDAAVAEAESKIFQQVFERCTDSCCSYIDEI